MALLCPGLARIPDAAFFSWHRFPGRKLERGPFVEAAPDLAVEVISPSNTRREIERKIQDYFQAGACLVWCVYPLTKTVRVFTSPEQSIELNAEQTLDGGDVLPGFTLARRDYFADPA
jgi:Uma2 family endonuclease